MTSLTAARTWLARHDRSQHPSGRFDSKSRWLPASEEFRECCARIRRPSARWPYSLLTHCRSKDHVARLHDVALTDLQHAIYVLERWPDHADAILSVVKVADRLNGAEITTTALRKIAERIVKEKGASDGQHDETRCTASG